MVGIRGELVDGRMAKWGWVHAFSGDIRRLGCGLRTGPGHYDAAWPCSMTQAPVAVPAISLGNLFTGFLGIGIIGFGGVLPWARRMMVDQRQWLSAAEFTDLLALCQFLPGPNIVNMAVSIGARSHRALGSVVAVAGLLAAPMVIVIGLGGIYARYEHVPVVVRAFGGLAAAASGLVIAMAIRIASPQRTHVAGIVMAGVTFLAVAVFRMPLLPTMLVMAPASILLCRRFPV